MAKKKTRTRSKKKKDLARTLQFEIVGLVLLGFSIVSLANLGAVSKACRLVASFFMGDWAFILLLGLMALSLYLMYKREIPNFWKRQFFGLYLILIAWLLMVHISAVSGGGIPYDDQHRSIVVQTWKHFWTNAVHANQQLDMGGGILGAIFYATFHFLFAEAGSRIVAIIMGVIGTILLTGLSFKDTSIQFMKPIAQFFKGQWRESVKEAKQYFKEPEEETRVLEDTPVPAVEAPLDEEIVISNFADHIDRQPVEEIPFVEPMETAEVENLDYLLPPLTLLNHLKKVDPSYERGHINENAKKLEQTLASFGVKAKITQIHLGPAVTQYEVNPETGVKVSRIVSLTDDIALALAAKDIRIEAPIPGKSAIGIEVPNQEISMVSLREVLEEQFPEKRGGLLRFALGRDISGTPISWELNKMPHLLVAGSTGSGKSVCINGIITSILMRAKPHEVKMMMIDPKMVELNVYNGIPHLLTPVVTDPKKAAQALRKIVLEMERRYALFSGTGTRNMEGYNDYIRKQNLEEGINQPLLPYIVVLVDELADLMMVASSEVEDAIIRIAQMARAAGIHLIIATQRPSVDVITGIIKANIPSRIAFSVSSQVDSRTILDMGGAEKLLGRGDMLFLPVGESKPIRIQGAFVSDKEVEKVVSFVSKQQKAQYQEEMIPDEVEEVKVEEATDELYDDAVQLVIEMQTASVSLLQRRFRIGYARAARLIDEMEIHGIVGPYEGSKPRNVLISKDFERRSE